MKSSLRWLNRYLEPGNVTADEADAALTHAGFPIDAREPVGAGDTRLEVEITSNRGDCLSHIGQAREIAACTGRTLREPAPGAVPTAGKVGEFLKLENRVPRECPRFTARVIRGVKVGPSPAWLVEALESVGQRSINNVVDVTNFLTFEYGQPSHVFDLKKLAGGALVVRFASDGEELTTLDGKMRKLKSDEVVVADGQRAQSLAGVIGGADSEVSAATTDVVVEAATWDPLAVRRAARRHGIRTDASHRFERYVDARTIDAPALRAAGLIIQVAGGAACEGVLDEGAPRGPQREVALRVARVARVLGIDVPEAEVAHLLSAHGVGVSRRSPGVLACVVPPWRADLTREIDLIEEVVRTKGLVHVPMRETMPVTVRAAQGAELAVREIGTVLTGLGFYETVTFSFVRPALAAPFLATGLRPLAVDDDRRRDEGTLRPSIIPSLMACRRANQDAGVDASVVGTGGVRLFETAAVFAEADGPGRRTVEARWLGLLIDVPGVAPGKSAGVDEKQHGVRLMRGAIEAIVRAVAGDVALELRPGEPPVRAFEAGACAEVAVGGQALGRAGLIGGDTQRLFDLHTPVVAAELDLDALVARYPARPRVTPLPAFPGIERDLSLVVDEAVTWQEVHGVIESAGVDRLERAWFVGTYRGKQAGTGKKSVTVRLRFRDASRTLRHEEVDPQVAAVVQLAGRRLGAELRK